MRYIYVLSPFVLPDNLLFHTHLQQLWNHSAPQTTALQKTWKNGARSKDQPSRMEQPNVNLQNK